MLQGSLPKKVLESIEDLVTDANFDCSSSEFSLQAMDSSHVALLCSDLRPQRLDAMSFNLNNMSVQASGPKAAPSPSFSKAPSIMRELKLN